MTKNTNAARWKIALLFVLKALAIPAFYLVYEHHYGGLAGFDSGKFYNDARVLNECARKHPGTFISMFAGLQDENAVTGDHRECLDNTQNWLKGRSERFFYHDNRLLIRVHTVLHFFAFDSWFVHAFFSCLMSFIGLIYIFRALRKYFAGNEFITLAVLCLFPSLWFYTGGFLKEGLMVLVLGLALWFIRNGIAGKLGFFQKALLLFLFGLSIFLKPYLLLTAEMFFALCLFLEQRKQLRYRTLYPLLLLIVLAIASNVVVKAFRNKTAFDVIAEQQRTFNGMSAGGIFLSGDTTYLRLPYDTSLVKRADKPGKWYTINRGVRYMYWNDSRRNDTLFNQFNTDTVSKWELEFATPPSRSNFKLPNLKSRPVAALNGALYHSLLFPLFFNADTLMDWLASAENILLVVSLLITLTGLIFSKKCRIFPVTCLLFALVICLVVSLTSPNTGAIIRYRAPAVLFLLLAALYYLPTPAVVRRTINKSF